MGERQVFQEVGQQEQRPGGINRNMERGSYVSGGGGQGMWLERPLRPWEPRVGAGVCSEVGNH